MSKIKNLFIYKLLFFSLLMVITACNSKQDMQKLEAEVYELMEATIQMFSSNDLEGLVNRFAEDGSLKLPNNQIVVGHDALRINYENNLRLENFKINLDITKIELSQAGDIAIVLADYAVAFDIPVGKFQDEGKSLLVLKRIQDQWKIFAENLSSNGQL